MTRRPTFINLFLIKLPITALSSISHRLSGIINFFIAIPTFVLFFLTDYLITDEMGWDEIFRAATFYFFPRARFGSSFSSFLALVRAPNYSLFPSFLQGEAKVGHSFLLLAFLVSSKTFVFSCSSQPRTRLREARARETKQKQTSRKKRKGKRTSRGGQSVV